MIYRPGGDPDDQPADRRSLSRLVRDLFNDAADLVRQEITLARIEIGENLRRFGKSLTEGALGGAVAFLGLLVLIEFLVIGLGLLLGGRYWLSALIVALVLIGAGVGMAYLGFRRVTSISPAPETTIQSARETQRWLGAQLGGLKASLTGGSEESRELDRLGPSVERPEGTMGTALTNAPEIRVVPASAAADTRATSATKRGAPRLPVSEPLYKRVFHEIGNDDVLGQGAKVAYFMFTSLPPALLVLFSLSGLFGGDRLATSLTGRLETVLPGSADDPESAAAFLSTFVTEVVTESSPGALSIGLLFGLWAASAVFVALTDALNKAYDVKEDRSWFKRRGLALGVMVGFLILFLGGSMALIGGPQISSALGLGGPSEIIWSVLQWPLAFLLVVLAFFLVYYVLPDRKSVRPKGVLFRSALVGAGLWVIATLGFRIYISNFGSFSETYGFVGAILVLLLWMYLTGITILVGGEVGAELERTS